MSLSLLFSIIGGILDLMYWQLNLFLHIAGMESVVNVTKTLMEKNSNAWSRMRPRVHPIGKSASFNPGSKMFDSIFNFRELLLKSSTIPIYSMLKLWN